MINNLDKELQDVLENVIGSEQIAIISHDGNIIGKYARFNSLNLKNVATNFSSVIQDFNKEKKLHNITLTFENSVCLIEILNETFICLVVDKQTSLKRAQHELEVFQNKFNGNINV